MLINTMNPEEITAEILEDYELIKKSCSRLIKEYDKERMKFKIEKTALYNKSYEIKSHKKNTWLFIFQKAPALDKYTGIDTINVGAFIYYYHLKGLRVFRLDLKNNICVYNEHLFMRYNERLNLKIEKKMDIVKSFFFTNGYSTGKDINKEGKKFHISICRDGLLLGEVQEQYNWLVFKTFISKELKRINQEEIEQELIVSLESEIEEAIRGGKNNQDKFLYDSDILQVIK